MATTITTQAQHREPSDAEALLLIEDADARLTQDAEARLAEAEWTGQTPGG
jgi:hypothetical protein